MLRYDFSALFADAWYKAMSIKNITSGFRITGIVPFNRNIVCEKIASPKNQMIRSRDIKFIPFNSPSEFLDNSHQLHSTPY